MKTSSKPKSITKSINFRFEENFFNTNQTYIHKTSILGPNVELDHNVKIGPFCSIIGKVKIHKNTRIYPNVSIGFPAQSLDTYKSLGSIIIGNNCTIREFVSIGSSKYENGTTNIGNNCYIMSYCHIAHDVILQDNVTLINNVNLGGHVFIGKNAFLMANCASHQFCRIGQYCALAPFSATRQDLAPFCLFSGLPAKFYGLNVVALKRAGLNQNNINSLKHVTKLFFQNKVLLNDIKKLSQKNSEASWGKDENVQKFLEFIQNSKRGVSRKSNSKEHIDG
ncbi:hypothetical protein KAT08_03715 [Candidatus Babeliales bacterium]|nr:hypothetical protein [Candidatus Babeliales bacterium]